MRARPRGLSCAPGVHVGSTTRATGWKLTRSGPGSSARSSPGGSSSPADRLPERLQGGGGAPVDQGALADAGLAGDEHRGAVSGPPLV
ncbi:hypothetical protein, partial [Dactylosporangium siamense]|uniref:hypothetical protein n=1 Tax=Dactylosporangium siamense TaxID=685454 RepID=UPI001941AA79